MKIEAKISTYIYFALVVLLLPLKWLIAWLLAVFIHEFCHYAAVRILGGSCCRLTLNIAGANMECGYLSPKRRIIAILAGPVGGFFPVLLGRYFPKLALCCWVLSVYNMLPVLPLDGGQVLQQVIKKKAAFAVIESIVFVLLFLLCAYISIILRLGILPLGFVTVLWVKNRKSPCKEGRCRVQ